MFGSVYCLELLLRNRDVTVAFGKVLVLKGSDCF